jgi:signal transduction histidine kinase
MEIRERRVSGQRLLAGGIVLAALAGTAGVALELWRFGPSDAAASQRVAQHILRQFDRMVGAISEVSARIAADPAVAAALTADIDGQRQLFEIVEEARGVSAAADAVAVTVYDSGVVARAWAGAPSDIPNDRFSSPAALFVTQSPLGLRLVHVQAIPVEEARRGGFVATEHELSPAPAVTPIAPTEFSLDSPLAPATLLTRAYGAGEGIRSGAIPLRAPSGELLAEAWVDPADLRRARADWRRRVSAVMVGLLGVTVLLLIGPFLDRRQAYRAGRSSKPAAGHDPVRPAVEPAFSGYLRPTTIALALTVAGGLLLWTAWAIYLGTLPPAAATLLIGGGTAAALVSLLAGPAGRIRVALRSRRLWAGAMAGSFVAVQALAGAAVAALIIVFDQTLDRVAAPGLVDLRHFSLHPWIASRLMVLGGVVLAHLAVLWGGTLLLVAASARWRFSRRAFWSRAGVLALWVAPSVVGALVASARGWAVPAVGLVLSAVACGLAALAGARLGAWYRHTTVAARILALFLAFLVPTLLLYPSTNYFAELATRRLITTQYAVQAQNQVQTVIRRMDEARKEVDALQVLPDLVAGEVAAPGTPVSDAAFLVWKQTVLARERFTSAVELYDADGGLVSRFALNVPEYAVATPQGLSGCAWDTYGEVAPFGAEERRMLHAERRICPDGENGSPVGSIVLHVMLEYENLPFISSQNPYFEIFRAALPQPHEGAPGASVEVAIYGWGLQPLYTSGRSAWPITDDLFRRLYASREPFWAEARTGEARHRVYFSNDRERIFAIGYPVLTLFDHFVHLAELTTFGGAAFVVALLGTAFFTRIARERPRVGRALLREIRASFYRKLFLAFVLAAIIPVLILALVIRAYFFNLLLSDIEGEAARTAAIAQRVIEEADVLLRRDPDARSTLNDDVMVWIEQVIDQDVNVFEGARLVATSERDLFASGVLPTRTPGDLFRAIVLQRLPSFVRQDAIGGFSYILAAAPVRGAGQDSLLTVPLALRQREIEREIDELDRGVHLAALFFVLLGAGIGLSMAERIADPVRRLTRATGRIAHGDFDARIAVRSVDELRRLVDAFNSMAAELKAQRAQLERTHRLEAWAEMARQVAHEIKNPLTPIQLSAEHLQRVHADRGEPMGPVLESCVSSILGQVRLLRQISSEFSSFASSPTARPAAVDLADLVSEVVDPYRTGLEGRIEIRTDLPADLPPVHVDRTLVARALANTVENALHAMPGSGTLRLEAVAEPDTVRLAVIDTGIGMDEEALARVFEPYFSTRTTGTGLGLTIARRNIELNGGTIAVASTKGAGTTVIIRLPRT